MASRANHLDISTHLDAEVQHHGESPTPQSISGLSPACLQPISGLGLGLGGGGGCCGCSGGGGGGKWGGGVDARRRPSCTWAASLFSAASAPCAARGDCGGFGEGFGGAGGRGAPSECWGATSNVTELTSAEQAKQAEVGGLEAGGFGCGSEEALQRLQRLQAWTASPTHVGSPCGSLLALPALSQHVNLAQLGEWSLTSTTTPTTRPQPQPQQLDRPQPKLAPEPFVDPDPNPKPQHHPHTLAP